MGLVELDGNSLSLEQFEDIVFNQAKVAISSHALETLAQSRQVVEKVIGTGQRIYSINTGFGVLSSKTIAPDKLEELQVNLIRSHCCGVGENHTEAESRALLLSRTNTLAKGFSGVRPELVEFLCEMLNHQIHPVIPQRGSVGASGDLSPLAHLASVVIGEGAVFWQGEIIPGKEGLEKANLKPMILAPKEGLSLINGTQQMSAMLALLVLQAEKLSAVCDLIGAASLDGLLGSPGPFASWISDARPFEGQKLSARRLSAFTEDSQMRSSHQDCDKVQDPYSFRCMPQVHGAANELIAFCRKLVEIELNSATDNPLVNWKTGEITSNGNFHGQTMSHCLDILALALCELGSLSERRTAKLIDPAFTGLPTFLVQDEGLHSGFMMAHVTSASLVSENKVLSHPASTDSIPTNNEKEDHVSMGPIAARKAQQILKNTEYILGTEMLIAAQAIEMRQPLSPNRGAKALVEKVRSEIPFLNKDRYLSPDMEKARQMIHDGSIFKLIQQKGWLDEKPHTSVHRHQPTL